MEIIFYRIIILILSLALFGTIAFIFYDKAISTSVEWLDHVLMKLFEAAPSTFEWNWLSKVWVRSRLHTDIKRQLKDVVDDGFDVEMSVKFVQADKVKVQRDRSKLIVMYNPGQHASENFINATLAYTQNCIPNAKTILDPDLKECISLSLAKKLIENHSAECSREFSSKYLVADEENKLAQNPYFNSIQCMEKKHFFTRVFLRALVNYGQSFDEHSSGVALREIADTLTEKLAQISDAFLIQRSLPNLVTDDDPKGLHYYLNEGGMRINLMFVRSEEYFVNNDTEKYVSKSREIVAKGVDMHFVLSGGHSIRETPRRDYEARVDFAKRVGHAIRQKVKELEFKGESIHMIEFEKTSWPIYCALFVGKKVHPKNPTI